MKHCLHTINMLMVLSALSVAEPLITCTPKALRGVPGQPLQLEVTVTTERVRPIKLMVPHIDILHLHSVEKIPIQRTEEGRYIQKRIIIWQGTEAGSTSITNLTVSFQTLENETEKVPDLGKEKDALTQSVPSIGITIEAVQPAEPPKNPPRPSATPPVEGNQSSSLNNPLLWRGAGTAGWVLYAWEPTT